MNTSSELARVAIRLIRDCSYGLITTADENGQPHATWMNFQTRGQLDEIFTVTAPTTQKVANLRANPRSEWMFFHPGFHAESIVYVTGETRIVEGDGVRKWWDAMPESSRSYIRQHCDTSDPTQFVALVTTVDAVTCCCPVAYRKTVVIGGEESVLHQPALL